jgi:succinate dehydrogenase/fumarate reductase cytochrome b subunit
MMIEWFGIILAAYLTAGLIFSALIVTSKDFEKGISEYTRPNLAIKLFFALVITVAWVVVLKFEGFDAKVQLKKEERK